MALWSFGLSVRSAPDVAKITSFDSSLIRDRPGDWPVIKKEAYGNLMAGKFDELEATEKSLRASRSKFPEGLLKVVPFYGALDGPWESGEEGWKHHLALLDTWRKAKPESILAASAYATTLNGYAWKARGGGYSSTVTDEGWQTMGDRLAQSRKVLEDAYASRHGKDIPPCWYSAMMTVALGQGWPRDQFDKLFDDAVASYADYLPFYVSKAYFLLPRWYGAAGEEEKFVETEDPELYTRIFWSMEDLYTDQNFFTDSGARWDLMKAGFEDIEKRWPTSLWNLNAYCHFAVLAGDKVTARKLFDRIGEQLYTGVWHTEDNFYSSKSWAESN